MCIRDRDTIAEPAVSATVGTTDNTAFPLPEGPEESTIFVEPVDGISDDFYRGMDASAVLALENSGVKYYNFDGEEQDVFMLSLIHICHDSQCHVRYIVQKGLNELILDRFPDQCQG